LPFWDFGFTTLGSIPSFRSLPNALSKGRERHSCPLLRFRDALLAKRSFPPLFLKLFPTSSFFFFTRVAAFFFQQKVMVSNSCFPIFLSKLFPNPFSPHFRFKYGLYSFLRCGCRWSRQKLIFKVSLSESDFLCKRMLAFV